MFLSVRIAGYGSFWLRQSAMKYPSLLPRRYNHSKSPATRPCKLFGVKGALPKALRPCLLVASFTQYPDKCIYFPICLNFKPSLPGQSLECALTNTTSAEYRRANPLSGTGGLSAVPALQGPAEEGHACFSRCFHSHDWSLPAVASKTESKPLSCFVFSSFHPLVFPLVADIYKEFKSSRSELSIEDSPQLCLDHAYSIEA